MAISATLYFLDRYIYTYNIHIIPRIGRTDRGIPFRKLRTQNGSLFVSNKYIGSEVKKAYIPSRKSKFVSSGAPTYEENTDLKMKEVHNIAFLKVHKAASSTVQNIFLRFGLFRNLTFVIPQPPGHFWRKRNKPARKCQIEQYSSTSFWQHV